MIRKILALLVISALPLVGCETQEEPDMTAEEDMRVDDYDAMDMDDNLAGEEGAFSRWDADADGSLNETEFRQIGYFDEWDADAEIGLSEEEFTTGMERSEGIDAGTFETWDENDDGLLEEEEFYSGLFEAWDLDDSGAIEQTEYSAHMAQPAPGNQPMP